MGSNGSYLPLAPLADRELSPQVARRGRSGSDLLDTEACAACPAGKYVVARGSDGLEDCAACAAGTYSAAAGATPPRRLRSCRAPALRPGGSAAGFCHRLRACGMCVCVWDVCVVHVQNDGSCDN